MDKDHQRNTNQARAWAEAIHRVASDAISSNNPADRILGALFRGQSRFGSRDRRMISETLFSLFRWWGWLRETVDDVSSMNSGSQQWMRVIFLAHAMDTPKIHPVAKIWAERGRVKLPEVDLTVGSLGERAKLFAELSGIKKINPEFMLPEWIWGDLPLNDVEKEQLLNFLAVRPPMWVRLQRTDLAESIAALKTEALEPQQSDKLPNAVCLGHPRINLYEQESFKKGRFEVQDFASQMIGYATQAQPGQRWWDACAGAGGKTLQLADMMENRGTVVASDIREYKLKDLKKRARRAGFSNISPKPWPERRIPVKTMAFDGVLVDAPCSCTGTWRRNPDARWTTTAGDITDLPEMQLDILSRACKAVREGGALVYATCSMCRLEDEAVVEAFLSANDGFELDPILNPLTGELSAMIRTWPWDADCDATFVARMRRVR